ncbi:ferrochelatase [Neisseria bacilliformis ATCC BAA-1200]|uniref:Ferrochelatase n=1 Tax=Neisseria bacilliformis ATCC BAA-1200 TaxID=888742 RepID=F2BEC3_9NEIS|nr:ferrochelatase [Neisseria bacilliformis ATCC BAA-1200]
MRRLGATPYATPSRRYSRAAEIRRSGIYARPDTVGNQTTSGINARPTHPPHPAAGSALH